MNKSQSWKMFFDAETLVIREKNSYSFLIETKPSRSSLLKQNTTPLCCLKKKKNNPYNTASYYSLHKTRCKMKRWVKTLSL